MVDVFVSYSSADRERVRPLVERLEQEGWSVWWDRHIESGSTWDHEIEQALEGARCVVVLWTPAAVVSEWVRSEATEALERAKLVPVILDDVRAPLAFRRTQTRRLVGWPDAHDRFELEQMLGDVRALVQGARKPRRQTLIDGGHAERSQRRQVSVLHVALDGAAALADELEPEAMDDWTRSLEARVRHAVNAAGGMLQHFDGAGCSAAFGVQLTSEDDEVCAAEAAFTLVRALHVEPRIKLRMGLASGMVVVGPGAVPGSHRLSGNVASNAAALAAQAGAGQLLVSDATQRRLAPYFATVAQGSAFALMGRTAVRNRIDAARVLGLSPLVGRDDALAHLDAALEDAAAGMGRAICLVGEAGLGKSRLMHEFRHRAVDSDALVVEGRCLAHGQTSPFLPFGELLREALRLGEVEPALLHDKAVKRLLDIDAGLRPYLPHLLHVLAIASTTHRLPDTLEGIALRRALSEALVAMLSLASRTRTVALIVEDWHWADEASKELLPALVDMCASHRVMLVVCARPEAAPAWPPLQHCSQLVLRALSRAQVAELVRALARADTLDAELATLMHARTDGVPLFVEELSRSLLEQGHVGVEGGTLVPRAGMVAASVPGSVEAVVRARLDRLDEEAQELLRVASVVGREFERRMLDALFDDALAVSDMLAELVAQGLVQQTRVVPEPAYRFRHLLTQVVAYESLLLKQRRGLHQRVGEIIEQRHAGRIEEQLELLAHHFQHGAVAAKAIDYLLRAGQRAVHNAALLAAIAHLSRAMELLDAQEASPARDEQLLQACVLLGSARTLVQGYAAPEVVALIGRTRELCHGVTTGEARFACLWMLWRYHYNCAMVREAGEVAAQMMVQAALSKDAGQLLAARTAQGVVHHFAGRFDAARAVLEEAVASWDSSTERALAFRYAMSPTVQALAFLGVIGAVTGEITSSLAQCERAVALAREIDHPPSEVLALQYHSGTLLLLEDLAQSASINATAMALATRLALPHWLAVGRMQQGTVMMNTGDVQAGLATYQAAATAVNAMGVGMLRVQQHIFFGTLYLRMNRIDDGLEQMSQARDLIARGGMCWLEAEVERVSARLMWSGNRVAATTCFTRGLELARQQHSVLAAMRLSCDWAEQLAQSDQAGEGLALLRAVWREVPAADRGLPTGIVARMRGQIEDIAQRESA